MPEFRKGDTIRYFGDYVLFGEVGQGATGSVQRARQISTNRTVALKLIRHLTNEAGFRRVRTEAEAVARLEHPNIVQIHEIGEHEGQAYLAMQFVDGESLAERIARLGSNVNERDAGVLMAKLARAVHHAHLRGVLHRDLKPGNILIDESDEPHLIDFGLAKCLEQESGLTQTGEFMGTPAYTSPEQAAGRTKSVTTASDIYSLGAILYTQLTGQPPFAGGSIAEIMEKVKSAPPIRPRSIRPTVSSDLETICLKCLEKEPVRRYASALELAEDLERFLGGRPIAARPVGALERLWMWTRRNPVHAGLTLATVLVGIASLVAMLLWGDVRSQERENQSLIDLGSTIAIARNRSPRQMLWSEKIRASLTPERIVTQKSYYRDQVASTFEGWDGKLLATHAHFLNEQLVFDGRAAQLLLAGVTNASTWRIDSTQGPLTASLPEYPGKAIAFPAGAPLQVVQTDPGKLIAWSAAEQRSIAELERPQGTGAKLSKRPLLSAASTATNLLAMILSSDQEGDVLVCWELPSGKILNAFAVSQAATAVAAVSDGSLVACGDSSGQVRLWNVSSGHEVERLSLSALPVRSLAFAPSVQRNPKLPAQAPAWLLAIGDEGGSIGIWDLADRLVQALCRGGHYQVFTLAFSPDNSTLASAGRGPVRLWDARTGAPLLDLGGDGQHFADYCGALAFSADGFRIAASANHHLADRQVFVWELQNGRGVATLRGLLSSASKVAFSPDGDRLAAVGLNWEVAVWDLPRKALLHLLETPRGATADNFGLAFSPDGRRLACSAGEEAQLWDLSTGRLVRSWKLPPGICDALGYRSDDALLLLRMETLQGTEMPSNIVPWRTHPRVCRLRNLLAAAPSQSVREIHDFNIHVWTTSASSDGRFFAIEGIGSTNQARIRKVLAIESSTGGRVWEQVSTKQATWGAVNFTSRGTHLVFTTNGPDWKAVNLEAVTRPLGGFPHQPDAVGPDLGLWAMQGAGLAAGRGVSLFENGALRLNLGFDSEILIAPAFDRTGRWLAWGNTDGTVSLCDLPEVRAQLGRSGLKW